MMYVFGLKKKGVFILEEMDNLPIEIQNQDEETTSFSPH